MFEFVPLLVLNFQLVAYPLWPSAFVLGVKVAFVVWDVLWRCVRVTIAAVFGVVFAACGISFPFLIFLSVAVLDRCLLLLYPFEGGGVGEQEVDGDGDNLLVVFLSILRQPLLLPLLWPPSSLLVVAYALSMSELSEERLGCCCTS